MSQTININLNALVSNSYTADFYFMTVSQNGILTNSNYGNIGGAKIYINGIEYYNCNVNLTYNYGDTLIIINTQDNKKFMLNNCFLLNANLTLTNLNLNFSKNNS